MKAEKVQVSGNYIELWQPDSQDWWHLYAYFNGEQLTFSGRFQSRDHVVRGHNKMYNTLKSDSVTAPNIIQKRKLFFPVPERVLGAYAAAEHEERKPEALQTQRREAEAGDIQAELRYRDHCEERTGDEQQRAHQLCRAALTHRL